MSGFNIASKIWSNLENILHIRWILRLIHAEIVTGYWLLHIKTSVTQNKRTTFNIIMSMYVPK